MARALTAAQAGEWRVRESGRKQQSLERVFSAQGCGARMIRAVSQDGSRVSGELVKVENGVWS